MDEGTPIGKEGDGQRLRVLLIILASSIVMMVLFFGLPIFIGGIAEAQLQARRDREASEAAALAPFLAEQARQEKEWAESQISIQKENVKDGKTSLSRNLERMEVIQKMGVKEFIVIRIEFTDAGQTICRAISDEGVCLLTCATTRLIMNATGQFVFRGYVTRSVSPIGIVNYEEAPDMAKVVADDRRFIAESEGRLREAELKLKSLK